MNAWPDDPFAFLRSGFEKDEDARADQRQQKPEKLEITAGPGALVESTGNRFSVSRDDS